MALTQSAGLQGLGRKSPAWILAFLLLTAGAALGEIPNGYYDSADDSSSTSLRQTLHEVIDDHIRFPYSSSNTDTAQSRHGLP